MPDDLIKDNFCVEADKDIIHKNIRLIKIAVTLTCMYMLMAGYFWINAIAKRPVAFKTDGLHLFRYYFSPVILLGGIILNLLGMLACLKGNRLIKTALEQNDALLFNNGYKQFYKSGIFALITIAISLIHGLLTVALF
jgi:hypothetical protein